MVREASAAAFALLATVRARLGRLLTRRQLEPEADSAPAAPSARPRPSSPDSSAPQTRAATRAYRVSDAAGQTKSKRTKRRRIAR